MELFLMIIIKTKETRNSYKFSEKFNYDTIYTHKLWHLKMVDLNCMSLGRRKMIDTLEWWIWRLVLLVQVIFNVILCVFFKVITYK